MIKNIGAVLGLMLGFVSAYAENNPFFCESRNLVLHPENILYCAKQQLPILPTRYKKIAAIKTTEYTRYIYTFTSLTWPDSKNQRAIYPEPWHHEINIFIPNAKRTASNTAVLYVAGGMNEKTISKNKDIDPLLNQLVKQTIVIVLREVPNQYLIINGVKRKEDAIIAFSWQQFILHPDQIYSPLHVPMTIAVSEAMTIAQQILSQKNILIKNFVVTGLSKRGWATWLTALLDERVCAIIPIVTDILNMKEQIPHLFKTYGHHWPIAFFDYYQQNIPAYADPANSYHKNYLQLLKIEDPFTYLIHKKYREKIRNIPKYIINASGDDFFLPEASQFYFNDLPGEKSLFYVPNSNHDVEHSTSIKMLASAVLAFYNQIIHHKAMPSFNAIRTPEGKIIITYQQRPDKLIFWLAKNFITRDFRYACGIRYQATNLKIGKNQTVVSLPKTNPSGWNAAFVTANFKDLQVSTPIFIYPETYPKENQMMPQQGACRLII